jgi:glucans biosynthesis protein C
MTRINEIDSLRVIAFGLLIFYHIGMFFVPWEWHLKNSETYSFFQPPMLFLGQWRLSLLFFISGMGTYFAFRKRSNKDFLRERTKRLIIPLVFGMIVIVPPQVYLERIYNNEFYGSYWEFWLGGIAFEGIYPSGNFSWHHLWFLVYLFLFSVIFIALKRSIWKNQEILFGIISKIVSSWMILIPMLPIFIGEYFLAPNFPPNYSVWNDWFNLYKYSFTYILGFIIVMGYESFIQNIEKKLGIFLILGILSFSFTLYDHLNNEIRSNVWLSIVKSFNLWIWILILFGISRRFVNGSNSFWTYCNNAVYPFYILHQTVILVLAYPIIESNFHWMLKFLYLTIGTFSICFFLYQFIIRKLNFLKILFGVKS